MKNSDLSPELALLVNCLKDFVYKDFKQTNEIVLDPDIDWTKFQQLLNTHGVPLPVYHTLLFRIPNSIPIEFKKKLHQIQNFSRKRNRNLFFETSKVIAAASDKNITLLPYKGLPFAKQFYGNIFQRSSVDIDFALGLDKFQDIKDIMLSLGYEEYKSEINHDLIKDSRAYYLDYPFIKRNKNGQIVFNVEFHWTPSHQILNIPISFDEFNDQTVDLPFGAKSIKTFDKVYQALFAIIHHGNVDCWGKLKHLVDLALILNALNEKQTLDLEALCKKYHIFNSLQIGRGFLATIFDDPRYQHIKVSSKWVNDTLLGKLAGKWSENKMKFWYYLSSRDNFNDKMKATLSILKYQLFIKSKFD